MSRSAAPSIDVTRPMRRGSAGSGRLRAWSNRPSSGELLLELLERLLQGAETLRLHVLADDLILALRVVDADLAARHDLQAVFRLELQVAHRGAEHHRLDLRRAVLEREVQVPGVPDAGVRESRLRPTRSAARSRAESRIVAFSSLTDRTVRVGAGAVPGVPGFQRVPTASFLTGFQWFSVPHSEPLEPPSERCPWNLLVLLEPVEPGASGPGCRRRTAAGSCPRPAVTAVGVRLELRLR